MFGDYSIATITEYTHLLPRTYVYVNSLRTAHH